MSALGGFAAALGGAAKAVERDIETRRAEKLEMLRLDRQESQFSRQLAQNASLAGQQLSQSASQFEQTFGLQKDTLAENKRQFDETKGQGKVTDKMAELNSLVKDYQIPESVAMDMVYNKSNKSPKEIFIDLYNKNLVSAKDPLAMDTPESLKEKQNAMWQQTREQMTAAGYDPKEFSAAPPEATVPAAATDSTVPAGDTAVSTALPPGVTEADAIQTAVQLLKAGKSKAAVLAKILAWGIDPTKVPGL